MPHTISWSFFLATRAILYPTTEKNHPVSRCKYWATCSSVRSHRLLIRTACCALLRSFIHLLNHSFPSSWESEWFDVSKRPGFVSQRSGLVIPRDIRWKAVSERISYLLLICVLELWSRTAKCPSKLWARKMKNPDLSTGPLARSLAHWLDPLTHYLAPHCSLCSPAMLSSLVCLLVRPLNPELSGKWVINAGLLACSGP